MDMTTRPDDIGDILDALDAAERDARDLVNGLSEAQGTWREAPGRWSVAECLDHLATANRVYLAAMQPAAEAAHASGRRRRGPAVPGLVGRWFVSSLEPPARPGFRSRSPETIRPRQSPPLGDAFEQFVASQQRVRDFVNAYGGDDLAGTTFPNPFIRGVRFSLATGLHVIAAHERRHLWQARRVRSAQSTSTAA